MQGIIGIILFLLGILTVDKEYEQKVVDVLPVACLLLGAFFFIHWLLTDGTMLVR